MDGQVISIENQKATTLFLLNCLGKFTLLFFVNILKDRQGIEKLRVLVVK